MDVQKIITECVDCKCPLPNKKKNRISINFLRCKNCYKANMSQYCEFIFHDKQCKFKAELRGLCWKHISFEKTIRQKQQEKPHIYGKTATKSSYTSDWYEDKSFDFIEEDKMTCLEILGLSTNGVYSADEIRTAFRCKALQLHPDKNLERDTTNEFQELHEAYEIILKTL